MEKANIICIDDERVVLTGLKSQISRFFNEKYNIEVAESAEEALEIINDLIIDNENVPVIICDQIMPGMKGDEFLIEIHKKYPKILKILLTGQADAHAVGNALNYAKLYRYISKPWEENDLLMTVKEAIRSYFQDKELQERNIELEELNKTLEEKVILRTVEVSKQKEIIEEKNNNITASITYASRIQNAVLPEKQFIEMLFPEHFILYKPCNIVSGDFYFIKQILNYTLIAAADCTGHGVPGAFMSMLGVTLLNEIVRNSDIITSSVVLDELRKQIKIALQQTGQSGEQQDGIDIAFCSINIENYEMSYAGAYNPLYVIRKNEIETVNKDVKTLNQSVNNFNSSLLTPIFSLITIEADRQPVGIFIKEKPFTEHKFQLKTGDIFYIFSDGYLSQFGGEKRLPLKTKHFKEILSQIYCLPLEEQNLTLNLKLDEWKGNNEQTDDILIIGIKIQLIND